MTPRTTVDGGTPVTPVILYVTTTSQDARPLLNACRLYAECRQWRVTAQATDRLITRATASHRPGWERVRRLIVAGRARGIVTYAAPMLTAPGTRYSDVVQWAEHRSCFLACAWQPAVGEPVRDTSTGRMGVRLPSSGPTIRIAPVGAGQQWTAPVAVLEPLDLDADCQGAEPAEHGG
ncbi:hypothetical protein ACFC1B_07415 [Streptomyces xiamenensis]|uniref:hypothetical protein n=1 Tax=Streptomyces xiamenensis TaxID=408015 RepID=UPI0035DA97BE